MADDNNNFSVDTEQLKNETKDTVNKVKDTIKNTNFKEGAAQTKGFLAEMFVKPFSAIKKVATGEENVLPKALIIMIVYLVASLLSELIYVFRYGNYRGFGNNLFSLLGAIVNPLIFVLVPAIFVLILNRKNKKSLITVISTIVVASVPNVINEIIGILVNLVSGISIITSPIITTFSAIGIVLTYSGIKELFGSEDDESFIKKFAIIKVLSAFIILVIGNIF